MAQYSAPFGKLVRDTMRDLELSDREVARRSRGEISYYTVSQMRADLVPNSDLIVAFALAVERDPEEFLRAAGKQWLRFDRAAWDAAARRVIYGAGFRREASAPA